VLFLRAAGDKLAFLRESFDPVRAAKAIDTPILVLNRDDKMTRNRSIMTVGQSPPPCTPANEEKRPLRRQPEDHHFWSLRVLAVTAAAFLLVVWITTKALFVFLQGSPVL
jgi:hypothetical protein